MNQKLALCIGINNYPGTDSDLSGCVNDANDWAQLFKDRGFQPQLLLDEEATGANMLAAMKALIDECGDGDSILIQYSGHGSYVPDEDGDEKDGTDECLCPYDLVENGVITDDQLFNLFTEAKQKNTKLVLIADSCHSGSVNKFAMIQTPPTTRAKPAPIRKVRFLPPENFLPESALAKLKGRNISSSPRRLGSLLLSGCRDVEYSYDAYFNDRPNGAFTYVALDIVRQLPEGATYRDWHKAIKRKLPSQQYPQSPVLFGTPEMKKWEVFS